MDIRPLRRSLLGVCSVFLIQQIAAPGASAQLTSPAVPTFRTPGATFHEDVGNPAGALAHGLYSMPTNASPSIGKSKTKGFQPTAADRASTKTKVHARQTAPSTPQFRIGMTVGGQAAAVAGNIIEVQGRRFTLAGVSAPPAGKICHDSSGIPWSCGEAAQHVLADVLKSGPVACRIVGVGIKPFVECSILGQSVNRAVVGRV